MGNSDVLLTRKNVEDMKQELDEVNRMRDQLAKRADILTMRLEAAKLFLGDDLVEEVTLTDIPAPTLAEDIEPLPDAIRRVLKEKGGFLTHMQIRELISRDPLQKKRFKDNPNYYYTAIKRLKDRHEIIQSGRRYSIATKETPDEQSSSASKVTGELLDSLVDSLDIKDLL
ncbi:hypothetical protein J0X12_12945 [Sneathiella sp. CAU 1612]|uniref:HTH HARE-type domain-containing protein n=1 Tax=Sneathiella sedimenti TaxID=2816034 RepID=A0ABS3F7S2_9PROT|nr:hypothetical protein [Sneathiella sedimenti]MBO0334528.1 hypothetical protein [Sneathiella sedimenti]